MPQDASRIVKSFENILNKRAVQDRNNINSQNTLDEKLAAGIGIKEGIIAEMTASINIMRQKKEISHEHWHNAKTSLKFYDKNTTVFAWNPNPHGLLSELNAIDYSQNVEIIRVKPHQFLTQMQPAFLEGQERVGNFYAPGSLPADFNDRADRSGIGIKGTEKDQTISDKSVYISKVVATCTALKSTASPASDTWSVEKQNQMSQGGGIQFRMSSGDYGKIVRQKYGEVQAREHGAADKSLKHGFLQPKKKNFHTQTAQKQINKVYSTPISP